MRMYEWMDGLLSGRMDDLIDGLLDVYFQVSHL